MTHLTLTELISIRSDLAEQLKRLKADVKTIGETIPKYDAEIAKRKNSESAPVQSLKSVEQPKPQANSGQGKEKRS